MFVTRRDLMILKMCLEQKFMTLLQIAKMFFPESSNMLQVPMKRVRILAEAGLLKTVTLRVTGKRFYVATPKAVRLLERHKLSGGLSALKEFNDKTWEHDEKVTDTRILFYRQLDFKNWIPERALKHENVRKKVPDGIVWNDQYRFIIELELNLKNKDYYERTLSDMCLKHYTEGHILYILEKESEKNWLMGQAKGWDRIYFTTLEDMKDIERYLTLENAGGRGIHLERLCRGGMLFPDSYEDAMEAQEDDEFFKEMRAAEAEFETIQHKEEPK